MKIMQHELKAFEGCRKRAWTDRSNNTGRREPACDPIVAEERRQLLHRAAKRQDISMAALGAEVGVARAVVSRWARGVQAIPERYIGTIKRLGDET